MAGKEKATSPAKKTAKKKTAFEPFVEAERVFLVRDLPEGVTRKAFINKAVAAIGGICGRIKQTAVVICKSQAELAAVSVSFWRLSDPKGIVVPPATDFKRSDPALAQFPEIQKLFELGAKRVELVGFPPSSLLDRLLAENPDSISLFTNPN